MSLTSMSNRKPCSQVKVPNEDSTRSKCNNVSKLVIRGISGKKLIIYVRGGDSLKISNLN